MGHQMPWETGLIPWHPMCAVPIWHDSGLIHSNKTKPNKLVSTNISLKRFCFGDKISLHSPGWSNIYLFSGDEDEDDDGPRGICHSEACVQDRVKLVAAISALLLCEDWTRVIKLAASAFTCLAISRAPFSHPEGCILSFAGVPTGKKKLVNYNYILMEHLCSTALYGDRPYKLMQIYIS